jgi:hypothetical protein
MHAAIRAANTFDRAVLRAADALDLHLRHDQPLPASYGATLRAVDRAAANATDSLPSLIESIAPRLTEAQVTDARQAAARARAAGDITTTVDMIRLIQQVSGA